MVNHLKRCAVKRHVGMWKHPSGIQVPDASWQRSVTDHSVT
jgi:hypothetical protein